MDFQIVLEAIGQYGYGALFFLLWLGIVGLPIPDEVIVMGGGLVTSLGLLKPIPSFLVTYTGVISGLSIGYGIGRVGGPPALAYLMKKKKMRPYIEKSQRLIHQYGKYALIISYFLPVIRHVVPYIVGINKMKFRQYALYSYLTGLIWTFLFYMMGKYFGQYIEMVGEIITRYGWMLSLTLLIGVFFFIYLLKKSINGYTR